MEEKAADHESDPAPSRASGHPVSSLLTTADTGRKSSSSLPEVVLHVREPITPLGGQREGLGAEGGGGVGPGVGKGDRGLGAIKKLFSKKPKVSKRKIPDPIGRKSSSRTSSISQRYHPEDDLQFAPPLTPASALSLDLTTDTNVQNLLLQSAGGEDSVYDWELGASFGNFHGEEADSLNDAFGSVHLNEQSEDTGDDVSERSSVLSQGSSRLRNLLVRSRTQTSTSSTSTGN